MKKPISSLNIPEHHQRIYNDYGDDEISNLAEHLDRVGQITPIVITKSGDVISGARRVAAAKLLGWKDIEAVVKDIPKNQEIYYIISANKQRSKTAPQICEEIDELYKIYSKGQGFCSDLKGNGTCSLKRNKSTRIQVAEDLGIASNTITQLRYIKSKRPDLLFGTFP